jgi:hypothetical protein
MGVKRQALKLNSIDLQIGDDKELCLTASASALSTLPKSMSPFSRKKKDSEVPSTPRLAPVRVLASSQITQQSQFPTNSQSHFQSPRHRERRQPQPVCPWSAHNLICGQWPSPHPRSCLTLSTSATAGGELFLFGGYVFSSDPPSNDLYVISTKDFSTTLLQTSGDVPSPRFGHRAVLTRTTLLIWGGTSDYNAQASDNYFYMLNLGTSDLFLCQDLLGYSS